ncbi:hypothetical protein [Escherichia coli]|uniref:hypothetical protein n=1 Tax=Escherichia coli TaxID=562 RepID=UPI001300163E|nr:hypothetical protein [Escherichia coli]EFJ2731727.1 hypothetical protein [Escherichia coli]EFJ3740175.1 hypothetical protein [Escherichia coli]EFO5639349.1 hypothetical protein [Escherichia coli]EGO4765667.1 hypothetical protein [Escherichia coli]EIS6114865.1 hypothetical protein [Escherichia coli]
MERWRVLLSRFSPGPQNDTALTDDAGPGRGRKLARRERATQCEPPQPDAAGGH